MRAEIRVSMLQHQFALLKVRAEAKANTRASKGVEPALILLVNVRSLQNEMRRKRKNLACLLLRIQMMMKLMLLKMFGHGLLRAIMIHHVW